MKLLTSKSKVQEHEDTIAFCLQLWDVLSQNLLEPGPLHLTAEPTPLKKEQLVQLEGYAAILRLSILADFYRFQAEDLIMNVDECRKKLQMVRAEARRYLMEHRGLQQSTLSKSRAESHAYIQGGTKRPSHLKDYGESPNFQALFASNRENSACSPTGTHKSSKSVTLLCTVTKKFKESGANAVSAHNWEDEIRWSRLTFSAQRRSYSAKMIKAFQVVKAVGQPMLLIESEWGLSCYYKLASAYSTSHPLELSAACIPQLREAVEIIHQELFYKLAQLNPNCQMLLYGILNCHVNWLDHNHRQIVFVPEEPITVPALHHGDLRCSKCLKNQTFRSSEVKGNPKNIDVEFDFERMIFGSSCCSAPMVNVPLCTNTVNTCTFTELKQMYSVCNKCKHIIFSESLVPMEMIYSRCTTCSRLSSSGNAINETQHKK